MSFSITQDMLLSWVNQAGFDISCSELVQETPFSLVLKGRLGNDAVYAKAVLPAFAHEGPLLARINFLAPDLPFPRVMMADGQKGFFLMQDAGDNSVRSLMPTQAGMQSLQLAAVVYQQIGKELAPYCREFIKMGVPDWSLAQWPFLYQQVLEHRDFLQKDGLSEADYESLCKAHSRLGQIIAAWGDQAQESTLVNTDLHDANLIVGTQGRLTFIDWSEAVCMPMRLALAAFLERMQWRYKLDAAVLCQDCGTNAPHISALVPLFYAFANFRLIQAVGSDDMFQRPNWQGRVSDGLRRWLDMTQIR